MIFYSTSECQKLKTKQFRKKSSTVIVQFFHVLDLKCLSVNVSRNVLGFAYYITIIPDHT
jgi:hypothetical protein